jgi:hypothetical protein
LYKSSRRQDGDDDEQRRSRHRTGILHDPRRVSRLGGAEAAEYFKLPPLWHYLILWADQRQIVHHRRSVDRSIENMVIAAGDIILDPPGITIAMDEVYAE